MQRRFIIGCDPGKNGGLTLCESVSKKNAAIRTRVVRGENMLEHFAERDLVALLSELFSCSRVLFIEQVPTFAGQDQSAARMCVLYGNYKFILGAAQMYSLEHPDFTVKELSLLKWMNQIIPQRERSRDRSERKHQLQRKAQEFWPEWKWTQALCDAPLIAEAGIRLETADEES